MKDSETIAPSLAPKRVLALDWYDGARSGLAEYDGHRTLFQFQLVSPDTSEPWAFALRASPIEHLTDLDEVLKPLGRPRYPVWVPLWRFESEREKDRAEALVKMAMESSSPVIGIVIARRIEDTPIAMRAVTTHAARRAVERMRRENAELDAWNRFCDETA
jgi:hypothetical protein